MHLSILSATTPAREKDLAFQKIEFSTHRGATSAKSLCTMAGIHFRKLPNSYSLQVDIQVEIPH